MPWHSWTIGFPALGWGIWGPIFLLQGAGVSALLSEALPLETTRAVFPYWFATWLWQNCPLATSGRQHPKFDTLSKTFKTSIAARVKHAATAPSIFVVNIVNMPPVFFSGCSWQKHQTAQPALYGVFCTFYGPFKEHALLMFVGGMLIGFRNAMPYLHIL